MKRAELRIPESLCLQTAENQPVADTQYSWPVIKREKMWGSISLALTACFILQNPKLLAEVLRDTDGGLLLYHVFTMKLTQGLSFSLKMG